MPLRSRPDVHAPAAAARVTAVLAGTSGGWVPPEPADDEPYEAPAGGGPGERRAAARDPLPGEVPAPVEDRSPAPAGDAPDQVSWAGRRPVRSHAAPVDAGGWRLDPGRRGAAALVVVALLGAAAAGATVWRGRPQEVAVPAVVQTGVPLPGASPSAEAARGEVVVAVSGRVARPGLVRLPAGSRVDDAVRAAGGPVAGASTGLLNLARRLVDGEQVLVGVDPPPGAAAPGTGASGGLVDLNVATAADLDALPGIGPVLAQRIVDWRAEHGRFASVEQLREVTGIGESKYSDLAPKVTV